MLTPTIILCVIWSVHSAGITIKREHSTPEHRDYMAMIKNLEKRIEAVEKSSKATVKQLARQMIMQQLFVEERIRSDGDSGIKQTRDNRGGTRSYHSNTFTSGGVASIHEHANYDRTVGMGEFVAVLNGVEFRTRHNDYKLMMPSTKSKTYNALEKVPFPPVPPSVLKQNTIQDQIAEMRKYFNAFHEQNTQIRNWKPYFKPVMCYLEGGWTTNTKTLEEPFESDRHNLEASSWFDLQEKIRYTSYTGGKNNNENFSFLPTCIANVTEDGIPIYSQWNYRIVCHPVRADFDLSYMNLIDDLAVRMRLRKTFSSLAASRAARFSIYPKPGVYIKSQGHGMLFPRGYKFGKLDEIMFEIPGKDNYPGALTDDSFDLLKYRIDTKNLTVMNTGRYHRWYKVAQRGANGLNVRKRGYSDNNMWTAETSNPNIVESSIYNCYKARLGKEICKTYAGRYTYAIPLELIWLTPLSLWNPYNLTIREGKKVHLVTAGGRNGDQKNKAKAFNGVSFKSYYLTPTEFFDGGEVNRDKADTAKNSVGVLDQQGQIRRVSASGIRIFLPEIHGIGKIRQRYPIMPIHQDGSAIMKDLEALQDITMDSKRYSYMIEKQPQLKENGPQGPDTHYVTSPTYDDPPGMHFHDLYITAEEMADLKKNGTTVTVYTTTNNGHQHQLELQRHPTKDFLLKIVKCDGVSVCWDHHNRFVRKRRR